MAVHARVNLLDDEIQPVATGDCDLHRPGSTVAEHVTGARLADQWLSSIAPLTAGSRRLTILPATTVGTTLKREEHGLESNAFRSADFFRPIATAAARRVILTNLLARTPGLFGDTIYNQSNDCSGGSEASDCHRSLKR